MDADRSPEQLSAEFRLQGEGIRAELRKLQDLSDSSQSDSVTVLEELLQVCQRIEARMEASQEMLNKGLSLIFWVQLAIFLVLSATALGLLL